LAFIAGFIAGLPFGFMHLPAFAQALGLGHPGQGFIFFHLLQNRCCIIRSYLLQTVISKGDTQMTIETATRVYAMRAKLATKMRKQWEETPHDAYTRNRLADLDSKLAAMFRSAWASSLARDH
jgi:hypothetical protein